MYKGLQTILLLVISNTFMTFAWYGHLQLKKIAWLNDLGFIGIVLISWGIAFFEYLFMIPANRIGFKDDGGPFDMFQLKTVQEAVSIFIFIIINTLVFKGEKLAWNHVIGFCLIILAVYIIFKKW